MTTVGLSLTRRLIDRYYMFGLACVFLCVSTAVLLAWQNSFAELVAVSVTLPLFILLLGAGVLRSTVRLNSAIEQQLQQAALGGSLDAALKPLADDAPAALAWNALLAQLQDQRTVASLEARLSGSLGTVDQQRWAGVFNALCDGIAICDAKLAVVQANNSFASLLNAPSPAELIGKDILDLLIGICDAQHADDAVKLLQGGGATSRDLRLGAELSAGVMRVVRTPLAGEAFNPSTTLWTLRDVTQQKLAEEMRTQFVSTATHELRTPLTNIQAYAELLGEEDNIDLEKQKGFCNVIYSESARLSRFVDQLLNISQMEAGALSLARHETDVQRLLQDVIENVQPMALKKQIAFHSELPAKLPKLRLDKDKLTAGLINLLGNAIKYTPATGRVKLVVEVTDQIHFHVDDNGIGIAAEELPRISEKFFRSEDSRVRDITGSGLGLAFVQEVARLHGGRLSIASELNKGSRFTLTLPLS